MNYILIAFATVLIKGLAFADAIHDAAAKGDLRSVQLELDKEAQILMQRMALQQHLLCF